MHDYLNDLSIVISKEADQLEQTPYANLPSTDIGRLITAVITKGLTEESDGDNGLTRSTAIAHSSEITSFLYQLKHQPERNGIALIAPGTQLIAKSVLDGILPFLSAYRSGVPIEDIETMSFSEEEDEPPANGAPQE